MRKELTVEQAEAVWGSGAEVWFRFPHWGLRDRDRLLNDSIEKPYGPALLFAAYDVGGQWHHLGAGLPSFFVEVE